MIPELREQFNANFTSEKYHDFLKDLDSKHPGDIEFRVAETPIFVPKDFTKKMIDACESIVDIIVDPNFKNLTQRAIPKAENVPNETGYSDFIAFDFGICENEKGELEPQLIEMQGFPSLFAFQAYYPQVVRNHFDIPSNFSQFLNGYNEESYIQFLRNIILGDHDPENVILLEIKPKQQKTRIDFYCTQDYLQIPIVCLTELQSEGNKLFYTKDGKKTPVKRIYNRIIFDELSQKKKELGDDVVDITQPFDVEWAPHPNWFYRISKFTLPFIDHPYVPQTFFLHELKQLPADLAKLCFETVVFFCRTGRNH